MSMTVCQLSNAGSQASSEPLSSLIYYKADPLSKAQCWPIEHLTMNIFPLLLLAVKVHQNIFFQKHVLSLAFHIDIGQCEI